MVLRPLTGIQVVDLTVERGELCGRILSDLGADVIRIEPPGGSPSRRMAPIDGDHSLFWTFRNCGKRSAVVDFSDDDDLDSLHGLIYASDVVIDSAEPGTHIDPRLDADELLAENPHLIVASITAYGRTGPWAGRDVPNAVLEATGGMAFKAGTHEGGPILPPGNIADDTASFTTAFGILCALWQRKNTGAGQVIDASVNESVAQITDWSLSNWSRSADAGQPSSEQRAGPGVVYTIIPCADGFVRLIVLSPRQWHAIRSWLGEPDYLQDPELDTFIGRLMIADAVLNPLYAELFSTMTMAEVSEQAQARGIVCTPFLKPDDVLVNPHFESRNTFDHVTIDDGRTMKLPSGWFEVDGERCGPTGRPPHVGEHTWEVFASLWCGTGPEMRDQELAIIAGEWAQSEADHPTGKALPLRGVRVMDFGHGGVGVECGRMFGEYGADVVKIESRSYIDFIRAVLGGEMSPSFASSNRSKRSLGVNAKTERGLELLRQMVRDAEVVIENNSTGTMDSMGLSYDVMAAENPDVVMVSSQLMGSRGLWADWFGYGPNTQVTGGLAHLWNYENHPEPAGNQAIYPDHLAGRVCAVAVMAHLLGQQRNSATGGAHVEVCQVEQAVSTIGDLLAKESLVPGSVQPRGNHSDHGSPWGLYRCAGDDDWAAICVRNDSEWEALVEVMGSPAWATSPDLVDEQGRRANEATVDEKISEWTGTMSNAEVADVCLAGGVPAGVMHTASSQSTDAHLEARGYLHRMYQPPIGNMIFEGAAFHASAMDAPDIFPAPGLGEHTREIASEWLGLDDSEIESLVAEGVLEIDLAAGD
ncbi:MAG: CoA transferase [Acidimicrobiaceae bacterium]|nr:CoA transferase [Acidimicrobiaceae bacterium]MYD05621.1 CoA transferase [Acidimicrobiaceae bacterium]MYI57647.1 CoA transferase [Acidimicrobiaceae bacterium]